MALDGVDRDSYVLATKAGWCFDHVAGPSNFSETFDNPGAWMVEQRNDYSADWTERTVENSLIRLGVDRLGREVGHLGRVLVVGGRALERAARVAPHLRQRAPCMCYD